MNNITDLVPMMLLRARVKAAEGRRWRFAGPVSAVFIAAVIVWLCWELVK